MNQEELKIQAKFIRWAKEEGHKVGSINNGMAVKGWKSFNKLQMLSCADKGLPDVVLILNGKYRVDNKPLCLFIELKKEEGGITSKYQNSWITNLNLSGVNATVAPGLERACNFVKSFYQLKPPIDNSFIDSLK